MNDKFIRIYWALRKLMTAGLAHGSSLALPRHQLFGNKGETIISVYVLLIQRSPRGLNQEFTTSQHMDVDLIQRQTSSVAECADTNTSPQSKRSQWPNQYTKRNNTYSIGTQFAIHVFIGPCLGPRYVNDTVNDGMRYMHTLRSKLTSKRLC